MGLDKTLGTGRGWLGLIRNPPTIRNDVHDLSRPLLCGRHEVSQTRKNILVLASQDREEVTWIRIEGEDMEGHGEANERPRGPDIGWMPLSREEVERLEALGAVFSNRARERDAFLGQVCLFSIAFGFLEKAGDLDNKLVVAHGMLIGKSGELDADEEGWDFDEYASTNDDSFIPRTHGGVSGSAIWRIDLLMDAPRRKA